MIKQTHESQPELYNFAEWVLEDGQRRGWYDDAKMHWIGDPDPTAREHGRHPWVKRTKNEHEYVYSQPVLAAFSIAKRSLMSVRKDPWHRDDNPDAWFIGIHDLASGQVVEPQLSRSNVSAYGQMWLRVNYPGDTNLLPRDQIRYEAWLQPGHQAAQAEYTNGMREPTVAYEDIVSLESMMRVVNEMRQVELPARLAPADERTRYYAAA